ncbi:hypothetical protein BDEG_27354 [Batrachochytrium dendrobatidis JEL423]|uniref:S1 motif domain-containing protein n=1 Tax=Batrachochytrium dendrobatidis (strain JEL423) TaxID=403673 RepID=A0A177WVI5_BATDL|nr:hypothetical protein BDEG_27354 [Batrachochytrium dendrobatidis JEL423]
MVKELKQMVSTKLQDFPRGGASDFNPLEYRDISDKVKEDVLFGADSFGTQKTDGLTSEAKFNKKSKKRIVDNDFDSKSSLPKKSKTDFTALTVPILSYKKLDVGMCLLGVVKDINSLEMVVSLPNQLTGFVSLTEISDYISKQVEAAVDSDNEDEDTDMNSSAKDELDLPSLESYFQIGQSVVCKIISADQTSKNKRIDLSLKPEAVNEGIEKTNIVSGMVLPMCVTSKEDHGYILSLGIKGVSGFLKNEHASAYLSSKNLLEIKLGSVFLGSVVSTERNNSVIIVSIDPACLETARMKHSDMTELSHIRPGSLVTATIQDVLENGLALHIFKFFSATIDWFHLGNGHISDKNDIKNQFKKGQKVASRVLYLSTAEKKIGLTLIPELILQKSPNFKSFEIGTVSENITVLRVDPLFGLLVQYPGDRLGYVHMSRIADDHITKIDKAFRTGTTHRGRIVDHDYCNNLLLIAFAPKIVNQPFLRLVDIKAGIKVKGQIRRITPSGVVVSVTDSINGFCPSNHFSDVKIARPEKLFKEGATVAFHVLSVNSADKQLILTHKKSLMESKLPTITSYTEAQPGQITMGIITSVKNFGCIVSFYNNVHAIVPIVELSETRMDTPQDHFKIGQAIKCRVVSVDALNEKMCASFKLAALGNKLDSVSGTSTIQVGQIYDGIVVTKSKDTVISRVNDTDLVSISKSHLSDYPTIAQSLYDSLNTGSKITGLLAINIDKYGKPLITRKHSLIFQVQQDNGVRKASDMINDQVCFGFVRNIYGKLCFVEFTGGVVGAVSLQNISDNFVSSVSEHLQIGQSVTAYVLNTDQESGNIYLSLKLSHLEKASNFIEYEMSRLDNFFSERALLDASPSKVSAKSFTLGQVIQGSIEKKVSSGYLVKLSIGVQGQIHYHDEDLANGSTVSCHVLDYDEETRIVDLAVAAPDASVGSLEQQLQAAQKAYTLGKAVDAQIKLVKNFYIVLSSPKLCGALLYCSTKNSNSSANQSLHYKVGDQMSVQIKQVPAWTATQVAFTQQRILAMLPKATKVKDMVQNRVLENPVDPHLSSLQSIKPDMLIKCTVKSFDDTYINVCIADNLDGRIQATEIFDSFDQITDPKQPMASFQIGQSLQAKVIEVHIFKPHFHMTTNDKKSPKKVWIDLTVRPSFIATENALTTASQIRPKLKTLEIGSEHIGCIQHIGSRTLRILIQGGLLGDVFNMDISKDVDVINNASSHFAVGQLVKCFVIFKDTQKKTFNLSLVGASQKPVDMFSVGQKVVGYVAKIDPLKGINIRIGSHIIARVHITDLADEFNESPTDIYTIRQLVQAVVVRIDTENNLIHCSLRKSAFKPDTKFPIFPFSSFQKGSIVQGYIQSISEKGCFVGLTNDIYGRVKMCELSDSFVVDWKSAFKPGMLVKGRIISINTNSKQIELSFKKSLVTNDAGNLLKFSDIKVGQKSEGVIRRIEDYGLFIVLKNSELCGLCHVLEVADRPVKNLESLYSIGDSVMTVVLRTNPKKQQISLSIKPSRFNDDDVLENSIEEAKVQSSESENDSAFVDDEENDEMEQSDDEDISGEEVVFDDDQDVAPSDSDDSLLGGMNGKSDFVENTMIELDEDNDVVMDPESTASLPLVTSDFSWDTQPTAEKSVMHDSDSDSSSDSMQSGDDESDGDQQNKNKRKRRAKKRERAQEEKRIANKELELVEGDHPPETAEDFERLLLGSPNNSYIWIKYMVFYLNMAEIEKARQVAERALKTINFREEQERLNIWIAFLNLENTYGNVDTLSKVLERAIQMNDAKTVYFHMAKIYERTGKDELCIKLYQTMCKKFKDSRQVWVSYACFLLTHGKQDAARQLLSRSMQSLPKRKHVDVTSKFAQLEFNHGEPERGRTIFEGLMNSCPKRTDLWSVYIDMEIRAGDISIVRRLFDRVVQREWSARKMKFFFKKYFEFEKKHGDENGVQNVKQAAIKFVESL